MAKTNLLPLRKSAEHLKDVRLKDAQLQLVDLNVFQLNAIEGRKNPVNGRYVAALNVKAAIFDMYPNILQQFKSKPAAKINQTPVQTISNNFAQNATTRAPEVAPPPVFTDQPTTVQSTEKPAVTPQVIEQYRKPIAVPQTFEPKSQETPQVDPGSSNDVQRQAFIEASRAAVLQSYADGTASRQAASAQNRQTQEHQQGNDVAQKLDSNNPNDYGLAA